MLFRSEATFDVSVFRLDTLGLQDAMIENPGRFGLTNVTDPACPGCGFGFPAPGAKDTIVSNPQEYMYWDLFHYSAVCQRIVGDAAADLVLSGVR